MHGPMNVKKMSYYPTTYMCVFLAVSFPQVFQTKLCTLLCPLSNWPLAPPIQTSFVL